MAEDFNKHSIPYAICMVIAAFVIGNVLNFFPIAFPLPKEWLPPPIKLTPPVCRAFLQKALAQQTSIETFVNSLTPLKCEWESIVNLYGNTARITTDPFLSGRISALIVAQKAESLDFQAIHSPITILDNNSIIPQPHHYQPEKEMRHNVDKQQFITADSDISYDILELKKDNEDGHGHEHSRFISECELYLLSNGTDDVARETNCEVKIGDIRFNTLADYGYSTASDIINGATITCGYTSLFEYAKSLLWTKKYRHWQRIYPPLDSSDKNYADCRVGYNISFTKFVNAVFIQIQVPPGTRWDELRPSKIRYTHFPVTSFENTTASGLVEYDQITGHSKRTDYDSTYHEYVITEELSYNSEGIAIIKLQPGIQTKNIFFQFFDHEGKFKPYLTVTRIRVWEPI